MSAQLDEPLTPELRDTLDNLAAGLFGLDAWIKEPGKHPDGQGSRGAAENTLDEEGDGHRRGSRLRWDHIQKRRG